MIQSIHHPQYTRSQPKPQQPPPSLDQHSKRTVSQRQNMETAYSARSAPAYQAPSSRSHRGSQNGVPSAEPFLTPPQHSPAWTPRNGTQQSPNQVPPQNPLQAPQTAGQSIPYIYEITSQRPAAVWQNAHLYQIEINGKRCQLQPPPAWMNEEVATWKTQKSNLPQALTMTGQQLGLNCESHARPASEIQQEASLSNGRTPLANIQGQIQFNEGQERGMGSQVAPSAYPNGPAAIPSYQLADITNGHNEQFRPAERASVLGAQPLPNDPNSFGNIPALPAQEFYSFPRATNRVLPPIQTNVVSQPWLEQNSQRPISETPLFRAGLQQSFSKRGQLHPRQVAAPPHPPLGTLARDQWEIIVGYFFPQYFSLFQNH